jgi:iron complex outermembrane receptor protein
MTQNSRHTTTFFKLLTAILISASTLPAFAQTSTDETLTLEEVIVTAQKREQNLQDVPIAISVVSAADIEAAGFTTLSNITRAVPNLTYVEPTAPLFVEYTLRGFSTTGNNAGVDPGVGVYVDGVYLGRGVAFDGVLMDIERIEVLKGPQGTLFGKNTAIGAISIITRKPQPEFDASVQLQYGNFDLFQAQAYLNGSLVENTLFAKLSVNYLKRDGYLNNTTGGSLNDADTLGARAQFLWTASADFESLFTIEASRDRGVANYTPVTDGEPITDDDFTYDISIPQETIGTTERDLFAASLQMDYGMDNYDFVSISSYRSVDSFFETDQDYTELDALVVSRREDQNQFSQEFRIVSTGDGPLSWIAGFYYFDQDVDSASIANIGPDFLFAALGIPLVGSGLCPDVLGDIGPPFGVLPCSLYVDVQADIKSKSYAGFASITYEFTDSWSFTGGLRYTKEKKELDYSQSSDEPLLAFVFGFPLIPPFNDSFSDSEPSGDASLIYLINEDVSTYAKYSHGFKAGGYNATLSSSVSRIRFDPEFVDSYELGLKSSPFDKRLRLNFAAFYMDFDDKQEQQFVPGAGFVQTNAGKATSKGFEIDATALLAEGWDMAGSLGYANAKYKDFLTGEVDENGVPIDFAGNDLVGAPKWTANFSTQYRWGAFDWADVALRAEVTYQSSSYSDAQNTEEFKSDAFTLVNIRIGLNSPTDTWSFTFWTNNLFKEEVWVFASPQNIPWPGRIFQPINPRTYGVEFRYNF